MSELIHLCLSDLLDQDLSSYEYFETLPDAVKARVISSDVRSFAEMQSLVNSLRKINY